MTIEQQIAYLNELARRVGEAGQHDMAQNLHLIAGSLQTLNEELQKLRNQNGK